MHEYKIRPVFVDFVFLYVQFPSFKSTFKSLTAARNKGIVEKRVCIRKVETLGVSNKKLSLLGFD